MPGFPPSNRRCFVSGCASMPKTLASGGVRAGAGDTAPDAAADIMNALLALGYN